MKEIKTFFIETFHALYIHSWNLLFSGWKHMGDGHYHYIKPKEL